MKVIEPNLHDNDGDKQLPDDCGQWREVSSHVQVKPGQERVGDMLEYDSHHYHIEHGHFCRLPECFPVHLQENYSQEKVHKHRGE